MFKYGSRIQILGLFIFMAVWCIFNTSCAQESLNSEQKAKIEQLSTLEPYDMVLYKDGFIYMVAYPVRQEGMEKANWKLTLRKDYDSSIDYRTKHLIMWVEPTTRIIHQNDPLWAKAALCYLKDTHCKEDLGQ